MQSLVAKPSLNFNFLKMKLTTEQIECINQTLVKKVEVDDLRNGGLDHIASQIEYEMATSKNILRSIIKF
jgi:hypothetical protein